MNCWFQTTRAGSRHGTITKAARPEAVVATCTMTSNDRGKSWCAAVLETIAAQTQVVQTFTGDQCLDQDRQSIVTNATAAHVKPSQGCSGDETTAKLTQTTVSHFNSWELYESEFRTQLQTFRDRSTQGSNLLIFGTSRCRQIASTTRGTTTSAIIGVLVVGVGVGNGNVGIAFQSSTEHTDHGYIICVPLINVTNQTF